MGRVYRRKRRSCALCKPNKTGGAPRFKEREKELRERTDREIRDAESQSTSVGDS